MAEQLPAEDPQRLQALLLRHLIALAQAEGRSRGATVFEVEVAEVAQALSRATSGHRQVSETGARRALEDLMGPESIIIPGPPRLDILPCDGLRIPERYRVMFSGDPARVAPPDDRS